MIKPRPSISATDTALEAIPSDAYAAQQLRGFRWLRFAPKVESEYLAHMRLDQRVSALVCASTALLSWLTFSTLDLKRLDFRAEFAAFHLDAFLVVGVRSITLAVLIALVAVLLRARLPRTYPRLSFLSFFLLGASGAIVANVYKMRDLPQADLAAFAIIIAVFLPIGLTFYQSVATVIAIAIVVTLSGVAMLDAAHMQEHWRLSVMLFFTAFVGSVGAYLREHAQRDQFLLRRLLHHYAMQDTLTGIGNRRFVEQQAATLLAQARREGALVVLAILDIDHFKRFNDRYGHHAGDLALKQVASAMRMCLRRPLDLVGRLGGEEFGILLYDAAPDEAQLLLHRVVTTIADLGIAHDASTTARILTVSIGAATFDGRETLESLYRRADAVLYEAKDAGRNRARCEGAGSVSALETRNPQFHRQR